MNPAANEPCISQYSAKMSSIFIAVQAHRAGSCLRRTWKNIHMDTQMDNQNETNTITLAVARLV